MVRHSTLHHTTLRRSPSRLPAQRLDHDYQRTSTTTSTFRSQTLLHFPSLGQRHEHPRLGQGPTYSRSFSTDPECLYISPVFTSLLTHLGAKQNCVIWNRGRYAGVGTDDDERQGRLLLHAFSPQEPALRQVNSWLSAVLFSGLLTSSKNSTELSAIPPTNQPTSQSGGV